MENNENSIVGGLGTNENGNNNVHSNSSDFEIIERNVIFDRNYYELLVDIPERYWLNISLFLTEKKNRLIYLLKHNVNIEEFETFGFMMRFTILTRKLNMDK